METKIAEKKGKEIIVDAAKVKMHKDLKEGQMVASRSVLSGGKEVTSVDVVVFTEDEIGLALAKSMLTLDMVKDLNRQTITDVMNAARVQKEVTLETKVRRAKKSMSKEQKASIDAQIAEILAKAGVQV
jgi:hypothetical protein